MMIKRQYGLALLLVFLFTLSIKADVPPFPGFGRIDIDLVLDTKEDLSDYRFFLNFYGDLREIKVNSKSQTTIAPMGGGARYAKATLLAVPKNNLTAFAGDSPETLTRISELIQENKLEGVTTLTVHNFREESPLGIKFKNNPSYLIVREGNTISLIRSSNGGLSSYGIAAITAGILITVAILIFGVFLFRKVFKKV